MRVLGDGTQLEQETFLSHICGLKVMYALLFAVSVPVFNRGSSWGSMEFSTCVIMLEIRMYGTDFRSGLDFTHCVSFG